MIKFLSTYYLALMMLNHVISCVQSTTNFNTTTICKRAKQLYLNYGSGADRKSCFHSRPPQSDRHRDA